MVNQAADKTGNMVKLRNFAEKHAYIFVVGCALIYMLLTMLSIFLIGDKPGSKTEFYLLKALATMLPAALMAAVAFSLGLVSKKDFGHNGLGKGLLFGLPLLALFSVLYNALQLLASGRLYDDVSFLTILLFLLFNFMVGFSEEIVCRGLLFGALRNKLGGSGKGLLGAVLSSSFIFGVMHFLSILNGAPLLNTAIQVLSAALIGVFFCAVYIRAGSLLPVIIIHALFNAFEGLKSILTAGEGIAPPPPELPAAQPTLIEYFTVPMIILPFALYGLFLIRKQLRK